MTTETNMTGEPETIGEALQYCVSALESSDVFYGHGTDNAWDEALQLVLSVTELPLDSAEDVLPLALTQAACQQLKRLLQRRIGEHIPLPYLLGRAWFAGLEFHCDERAIIPRSPLAHLILNEFKPWYHGTEPRRILDLCCGGGCIGLATAYHFPQLRVDLADLDQKALQLAKENATLLGLEERVSLIHSNLFDAIKSVEYDIILSNPPYVNATDLATMPAEYHHEPEQALGSGADGLAITRLILQRAGSYLSDNGLLVVEVGNSWPDLEKLYPKVPFTWLEFADGGHGVFALSAKELQQFSASFTG